MDAAKNNSVGNEHYDLSKVLISRSDSPRRPDDAGAESGIPRHFAYGRLLFEEGFGRYWETKRTVWTPSAEQVRKPIFRCAVEQWRNYEAFLGLLRDAFTGRNCELDSPACEPLEA